MAIHLVTGVPGAGKTLRTVYETLRPAVGSVITNGNRQVTRRLMVAGIPQLLLDHEPVAIVDTSAERGYVDAFTGTQRLPGDPPHDVEHRADNWWLWCQPGDLICVDEAWQVFGTFPAGRKLPDFMAKLAIHRHYGIDFILIGQAPAQFHTFVRGLVDKHEFVRRMYASSRTVVYEWDHCSSHDRTSKATKSTWGHAKKAFGLYRSSQLHIKHKARIPVTLWILLLAVPVALFFWFKVVKSRMSPHEAPLAVTAPTPLPLTENAPGGHARAVYTPKLGEPAFVDAVRPARTWPDSIAGCWSEGDGHCSCVTQDARPRVVTDRPALCLAVIAGDLQPPATHPKPERSEPGEPVQVAGVGGEPASRTPPVPAPAPLP